MVEMGYAGWQGGGVRGGGRGMLSLSRVTTKGIPRKQAGVAP